VRVGVIQGRLSPPTEGFQECPKNWKREFDFLPAIGLNHVEWIITKKSFNDNPFFSCDLKKYPIHSVCADNLVDKRINDFKFVEENLAPICAAADKNGVEFITIPLLEESCLLDDAKRREFKEILRDFAKEYSNINLGVFTLQTARESTGKEVETIIQHLQTLRRKNEQCV
jgi:hypothetical protein